MRDTVRVALWSSVAALLLAASCSDPGAGTGAAGAAGTAAGAGQGNNHGGSAGNGGDVGSSAGSGSAGSSSAGSGTGGADAGESSSAGQAGTPGNDAGDASVPDAGVDAGEDTADASTGAADGEPCPYGVACGAGLICVHYGNPLPSGENSACRRVCSSESPPPDCSCAPAGYCENSVESGGSGGSGGSGSVDAGNGSDAGLTCGEVISNAGCADADDSTTDFQSGEFQGCLHWRDLGDGQGWIHYETYGGFHYDLSTSLGWVMRTDSSLTQAEAEDFCANFSVVGLSDWRLPTIDEVRTLAGGCANTAPGGSCPLDDSSCLSSDCGLGNACTSCQWGNGPNLPGNYYCRPDAMLCSLAHTTSSCADCPTPGDWRYGPGNGNFFSASVEDKLFPVCVMENIPRAVPCRN
jgi:hypothetical protein